MLSMVCGIPLLAIGALLIATGRIGFLPRAQGTRVRLIGLLLMIPFPAGLIAMILLGSGPSPLHLLGDAYYVDFAVLGVITVLSILLIWTAPSTKPKAKEGLVLPDMLTVDEAADYLHVSPDDIHQMILDEQLPVIVDGGKIHIGRDVLIRFLK